MAQSLLSSTSRVEVPYIAVKIGNYSFGVYNRSRSSIEVNGKYYSAVKVTYPNYIQSLSVQKLNGVLNQYTLNLEYPITEKDDPNLIDKILSSVSKSRKIIFTYGDCALPAFMYRNEEAMITNVTSQLSMSGSKITYTISAISTAIQSQACIKNFPKYTRKKPSDLIKEILRRKDFGLQEVFYGMHDVEQVIQLGLIPGDDREVEIPAKRDIGVLDYIKFLVSCMSSQNDRNGQIKKSARYVLTIHDDTSNILSGPYFKITKVTTEAQDLTSVDYYTIDIGYPNKDLVTDFQVTNNEAYSILYEYSNKAQFSDSTYRIGDDGKVEEIYSPALTNSNLLMKTTEADRTWWSQMTQYPIQATLTIKGLLRAAVLMDYIRVNTYFYGHSHTSSGLYIITKQVDEINSSGYRTTLSLLRVGGVEG